METTTELPTEIIVLGLGIVLFIVQLVLQTLAVASVGFDYALSSRDEARPIPNITQARLSRAFYNLLETFVVFVALALALTATGRTGGLGATGAWIWLIARIVYVPVYALGLQGIRTLVWAISAIGLVLMLIRLFL